MTRQDAIDHDSSWPDSVARLQASDDAGGALGSGEDGPPLPTILRWHDVQDARKRVVRGKEAMHITQLRLGGFNELELARIAGKDRLALRRRWHASIQDIMDELGAVASEPEALSDGVSPCLRCGERPRVRLAAVGLGVARDAERLASTCVHCLTPDLIHRVDAFPVVGELATAA